MQISYFAPQPSTDELPSIFPNPYVDNPHQLAVLASDDLKNRLETDSNLQHDFMAQGGGKMMGVLVIHAQDQRIGYLSGFSGMLGGQWEVPGFVPPVFELSRHRKLLQAGESVLDELSTEINRLSTSSEWCELISELKEIHQAYELRDAKLRACHAARRQLRHQQRAAEMNRPEYESSISRQAILTDLSRQSQADKEERKALKRQWRREQDRIQRQLKEYETALTTLKNKRSRLSRQLQKRLFSLYKLTGTNGVVRPLVDFFGQQLPPGGAGDCAGPKLLQYANTHGLKPLALAEFWWGAAPADGVRHHGQYYPACRGKCYPVLSHMLGGLSYEPETSQGIKTIRNMSLDIVFEDDCIILVNKPAGLLSVPGKRIKDSVLQRIKSGYPAATAPLLVHRLDMATSGLLLIAKSQAVHKALQRQFINRTIKKRYVAILDTERVGLASASGSIELPIRTDFDDRPRQLICYRYGKPACTHWQVIGGSGGKTRVHFFPVTGRTHQLRLHAAHRDGLNSPIVGDELYGQRSARMMLHAEYLQFCHPVNKQMIEFTVPAPF